MLDGEVNIENSEIINRCNKSTVENDDGKAVEKISTAIVAFGGTLTINNSTVKGTGNEAIGLEAEDARVNILNKSEIEGTSDAVMIISEAGETTTVTVTDSSISSSSGYGIDVSAEGNGAISNLTITNSTVSPSGKQIETKAYKGGKVGIVGMDWATVSGGTDSDDSSYVYIGKLAE